MSKNRIIPLNFSFPGLFKPLWVKIAVPIVISIALFSASIFLIHLPEDYNALLEKKKSGIQDSTQIIWDMVRFYHNLEKNGQMTRAQAQKIALQNIESIRFGDDLKNYFWINDLHPKMILHPYVKSLEGQDLNEFKDPAGNRLFVDMVEKTSITGSAFVSYQWQWQDNENIVLPKISFVKRYNPWGWIIGTGVYLDDVAVEARKQARHLLVTIMIVLTLVLFLSFLSVRQGMKAAAKIHDNEATLRGLFDQTMEFLGILDLDGRVRQVNKTTLDFAGITIEEIRGIPFWEVTWWSLYPEIQNKVREAVKKAQDGGSSSFTARYTSFDGKKIIAEVFIKPVRDENGKPVFILAVGIDVTERVKAEEELKDLNKNLEKHVIERTDELEKSLVFLKKAQNQLVQSEKMAALGGLVAGVAHEINTPLGLGVTVATFLQEEMDKIKKAYETGQFTKGEFEEFLANGEEATNSMLLNLKRGASIINSFKQVAVDQETEEMRPFKLKQYLDEVLLSLKPRYKHTGHKISVDCPDEIEMNSYPGVLMQIISNLLMNSLIHGFDGVENGQVDIRASVHGDRVHLVYTDNGNGMTEEQQAKIYDPFYTTMQGRGGTGLGMHIVFNLVTQKLCGSINLKTAPGQGVCFTLNLPLKNQEGSCVEINFPDSGKKAF